MTPSETPTFGTWRLIATAPKDGSPIKAKIPGHGEDNIIAWHEGFLDASENNCGAWCFEDDDKAPDCWTDGVCWEENERGEGSVKPTHWKWPDD